MSHSPLGIRPKVPQRCLNCAVGVLLSIISTFLVVVIIVGVVVYFVYYHDGDHSDDIKDNFEKLKDAVSDKYDEASKLLKN
ncbi:uncharacterized protein isoform X1 [Musca autumnalis]|uniref:uncharacterized protein isoform X1 n=1 Tax=Musca autumnalis TaxID=221902 RepID=UPI003CF1B54A